MEGLVVRSGTVGVGHVVAVKGLRVVQDIVESTVKHRAITVIHGRAGIGKTVATRRAVESVSGISAVQLDAQHSSTVRGLVLDLFAAVTSHVNTNLTYVVERELREELRARPHVILIDEVQRLRHPLFELLRSIHDDPDIDLALILVGGPKAWEVIAQYPMLRSRVLHEIAFPALTNEEMVEIMPLFHDLYATVDPTHLFWIAENCFGRLRRLAHFTVSLLDVTAGTRKHDISEKTIDAAFQRMGGRAEQYDD